MKVQPDYSRKSTFKGCKLAMRAHVIWLGSRYKILSLGWRWGDKHAKAKRGLRRGPDDVRKPSAVYGDLLVKFFEQLEVSCGHP